MKKKKVSRALPRLHGRGREEYHAPVRSVAPLLALLGGSAFSYDPPCAPTEQQEPHPHVGSDGLGRTERGAPSHRGPVSTSWSGLQKGDKGSSRVWALWVLFTPSFLPSLSAFFPLPSSPPPPFLDICSPGYILDTLVLGSPGWL